MTDNEIIKGFEYCFTNDFGKTNCNKCAFYTATAKCMDDMQNAVIDLINRQKAEIEELKYILEKVPTNAYDLQVEASEKLENQIKSEAIKEFAHFIIDRSRNGLIYASDIPDLVKEMAEGKNG